MVSTIQTTDMISKKIFYELETWFENYVKGFLKDDFPGPGILTIKYDHTKRVCSEIRSIGESLNLSSEELRLAHIIALFHDLGRFEQYKQYETFVDEKSVNHGELGVDILKRNNILVDLSDEAQYLIEESIKNHNIIEISEYESPLITLFSRMIRDADKLDIFHIVIENYGYNEENRNKTIDLHLPQIDTISEKVIQDIHDGRLVKKNHLSTVNDFKLLQMAWIFDINFRFTYNEIKRRKYLEVIKNTMVQSKELESLWEIIVNFIPGNIDATPNID